MTYGVPIPLNRYRMYGTECGECGYPLAHVSVYGRRVEMWHKHDYEYDDGAKTQLSRKEDPHPCVVALVRHPDEIPNKGPLRECPRCATVHTDTSTSKVCVTCLSQDQIEAEQTPPATVLPPTNAVVPTVTGV